MPHRASVICVDPSQPFIRSIAEILPQRLRQYFVTLDDEAILLRKLACSVVFLPTIEARNDLRSCFAERGQSIYTPHILALGDITLEDLRLLCSLGRLDDASIPPGCKDENAATQQQRLFFTLGLMVAGQSQNSVPLHWESLFARARQIDDYARALIQSGEFLQPFLAGSKDGPPDTKDRANHPDAQVLDALRRYWPEHLQANGSKDAQILLQERLETLCDILQAGRFPGLLVLAGSTGHVKPVRKLGQLLQEKENGLILFADVDRRAPVVCSEIIPPTHPDFAIYRFLNELGCTEKSLHFSPSICRPAHKARNHLIASLFTPAALHKQPVLNRELAAAAQHGPPYFIADDDYEEAVFLALRIRRLVGEGKQSIILQAQDKRLLEDVRAYLSLWRIEAEYVEALLMRETPWGLFLDRFFAWLLEPADAQMLLDLLDTPYLQEALAQAAQPLRLFRDRLDRALHGPRCIFQLGDYAKLFARTATKSEDNKKETSASFFLAHIEKTWESYAALPHTQADILAGQLLELARDFLYGKEDTESSKELCQTIAELKLISVALHDVGKDGILAFLRQWLQEKKTTQKRSAGAPVKLTSPLYTRFPDADALLLAGLDTEGWRNKAQHWRMFFGEHNTALTDNQASAMLRDMSINLCKPQCSFSFARKRRGQVVNPVPWVQKLLAIYHMSGMTGLDQTIQLRDDWHSLLASTPAAPARKPRPVLPVELRPKDFSLHDFMDLIQNPHIFFCKKILRLKPLDPYLDYPPPSKFGTIFHALCAKEVNARLQGKRLTQQELFSEAMRSSFIYDKNYIQTIWAQNFKIALDWYKAYSIQRTKEGWKAVDAEKSGSWKIKIGAHDLSIHARIDRIEKNGQGEIAIIDYKSSPPSSAHGLGKWTQLYAAARILQDEMVQTKPDTPWMINSIAYVSYKNRYERRENDAYDRTGDKLEEKITEWVKNPNDLLKDYCTSSYVFEPRYVKNESRWQAYAQFARFDEWANLA